MSGAGAVFLDRDGVLNRIVWREGRDGGPKIAGSPRNISEFVLESDAPAALARLKTLGFPLFAVTNQPDVSRGLMSTAVLSEIHERLAAHLPLDEISACVHDNADACGCRKPKPGLLLDLAARRGLDLSRSWMVGDQDRDVACGAAAGCRTVLLARSYNSGRDADHVVETLAHAVDVIILHQNQPPNQDISHVF